MLYVKLNWKNQPQRSDYTMPIRIEFVINFNENQKGLRL